MMFVWSLTINLPPNGPVVTTGPVHQALHTPGASRFRTVVAFVLLRPGAGAGSLLGHGEDSAHIPQQGDYPAGGALLAP